MRRLVVAVSAIQFVDVALLSALGPLLPGLDDQYGLGPAGAGRMLAAYAAGSLVAAVPSAVLAGRAGYRATVLLGLAVMALSTVGFGLAGSELALQAARFGQGAGSAISWTAAFGWVAAASPRGRRGATLGVVMSATVAGALAGPAFGALAAKAGMREVFLGIGAVAVLLMLPVLSLTPVPPGRQPLREVLGALREPRLAAGVWLYFLPALLLAGQGAIAPLHLDKLGWSAAGIGAVSIVGAALGMVSNPVLGRVADRASRLAPVSGSLAASLVLALLLAAPFADGRWSYAVLLVCSGAAFGSFFVLGAVVLADGAERAGVDHSYGFALANLAWSPASVAGSLIGGALADEAGDGATYVLLAAVCAVTLAAFRVAAARCAQVRS